jgi:hypothetical protein
MAAKPPRPAPPAAPDDAPSGTAKTATRGKAAARELSDRLADPAFQADIERAVRDLPPERAAELVEMLEGSIKRRKLELYGYLVAAAIVVIGMIVSLLIMGSAPEGSFVAWIFLVPLALAGVVMTWMGKRAKAAGKMTSPASKPR